MSVPFAHIGHWYVQLAFAVPALLLIGVMARDSLRRRRGGRGGPGGGDGPGEPPGPRERRGPGRDRRPWGRDRTPPR
jgi:hypothetical protein